MIFFFLTIQKSEGHCKMRWGQKYLWTKKSNMVTHNLLRLHNFPLSRYSNLELPSAAPHRNVWGSKIIIMPVKVVYKLLSAAQVYRGHNLRGPAALAIRAQTRIHPCTDNSEPTCTSSPSSISHPGWGAGTSHWGPGETPCLLLQREGPSSRSAGQSQAPCLQWVLCGRK